MSRIRNYVYCNIGIMISKSPEYLSLHLVRPVRPSGPSCPSVPSPFFKHLGFPHDVQDSDFCLLSESCIVNPSNTTLGLPYTREVGHGRTDGRS